MRPSPGEIADPDVPPRRRMGAGLVLLASLVLGLAAGYWVDTRAAFPLVAPANGTDEAFGVGKSRRRVTADGVQRWTGRRDTLRFERLPGRPTAVDLTVHNAMEAEPINVLVRGVRVGTIIPGRPRARFDLPPLGGREVEIDLQTKPRPESPGGLIERVQLEHARGGRVPWEVLALFAIPAVAVAAAGLVAGLPPGLALLSAALGVGLLQLSLQPHGLIRSPWAFSASACLAGGAVVTGALAAWVSRTRPAAGPWVFAAAMVAWLVQGYGAVSPLMPVSDATFHAHKVNQVARGDWFPVSVTQHAVPFRFPYGVAFYALLVPFQKSGLDGVDVVRWAAAIASLVASGALFGVLLPRSARHAGLAVIALQLLPVTFAVHSFGNLSNVFGQAVTVMFFAWWAGSARGGAVVGALLVALASLAHFSCVVVLAAAGLALIVTRHRAGTLDRTRVIAVVAGLAVAGAYYATFVPMVLEQLPRLREGGGSGKVARGFLGEVWFAVRGFFIRMGWPAVILALIGRPRPSRGTLDRDALAVWVAGGALALLALATPVEVRYVYALTMVAAIAVADGLVTLGSRGWSGLALAVALSVAQVVIASREVLDALLARYR